MPDDGVGCTDDSCDEVADDVVRQHGERRQLRQRSVLRRCRDLRRDARLPGRQHAAGLRTTESVCTDDSCDEVDGHGASMRRTTRSATNGAVL